MQFQFSLLIMGKNISMKEYISFFMESLLFYIYKLLNIFYNYTKFFIPAIFQGYAWPL